MANTLQPVNQVASFTDTTDVVVFAPAAGEQIMVKGIHVENKSGATENFIFEINRNSGDVLVKIIAQNVGNGLLFGKVINIVLDGDENDVLNARLATSEAGDSTFAAHGMSYT